MEIYGFGNDIVEIDRIRNMLNKNLKLLDKLFTDLEIEMLSKKGYKPESIAGNFSAKEAVVKSIGTGFRGFSIRDVQILRDELDRPIVVPVGRFLEYIDSIGVSEIKVSISHCKSYATSSAISIKK